MKNDKFYECIVELRENGKVPQQWSIKDIQPFLKDKFSANTITVYPYNCSISLDGKIKGDYIKKGQKPKFYRINKGKFELIREHDHLLTKHVSNVAEQFYSDFPTPYFYKETRSFIFDLSLDLIKQAKKEHGNWYIHEKTIDAILVLLFCWNFAAKITKQLQRDQIKELLKRNINNLRMLERYTILDDWDQEKDRIIKVFADFKKIMDQTGASKALSLLNPSFFIMWDTGIRTTLHRKKIITGIGNGSKPEEYLSFLNQMKEIIIRCGLHKKLDKPSDVAKKIDEYHYVKIIMKKAQ